MHTLQLRKDLGRTSLATGKLEELLISLDFNVKVPLNKNNNRQTEKIETQLASMPHHKCKAIVLYCSICCSQFMLRGFYITTSNL